MAQTYILQIGVGGFQAGAYTIEDGQFLRSESIQHLQGLPRGGRLTDLS